MTPDVLAELEWRGLIAQSTDFDELRSALTAPPLTFYAGFDPTAPSLHAGNLALLLTMRRLQLAGHRPVILLGGATGLIGDPSGRTTERTLNDADVVRGWVDRFRGQVEAIFDFSSGPAGAVIVDNLEWTGPLSAIDFLREIGKHFPVNQMLAKEAVATRLQGGLSFTEFSYPLLQANDYLQLFRRFDCRLQVGGSDQWGNLVAGVDFIRRTAGAATHALTIPLVTSETGEKFGKSTGGGRLWLDPEMTSPYAFYQYWINVDDRDVVRYLKTFTFLDRDEIEALEKATADRPAAREAQRRLAMELTTLVHGADECSRVEAASRALFGQGELAALDARTLTAALTEAPHLDVPAGPPPAVVEALADTGLVDSRSAARRVVREGGAYVNNVKVTDEAAALVPEDRLAGGWWVLRRGKRNVAGVRQQNG